MALLQGQLEGKYEILEKIKEGGMGAVYKVRHRFLDEIRVIKVIRSTLEPSQDIADRFLREARMAIRLRHPSIAVLHDFAVDDDGKAFIVMEHINGLTLEEVLRAGGPPPLGLALEVAAQALRAMGYLHRHGFVHRDIAPDNLMLTRGMDGEPLVKLIDLGIAKTLAGEGAATSTGIFLGKPRYASPEQFSAQAIDHRSDLYSFGVVLYELLTGRCPVAGNDPASYMAGHLFRPPLDFAESDPRGALPAELRRIVLRALAKTPADRFASAADLAREIAPLQEAYPVQPGDLDQALLPALDKTALWSAPPPPAGSSQVLLDRQFLVGTTPPPAAHHGSRLQWDPRLVAPDTLPAPDGPAPVEEMPPAAAAESRQSPPPGQSFQSPPAAPEPQPPEPGRPESRPAVSAASPRLDPSLDDTLPLTIRAQQPTVPPQAAPPARVPPQPVPPARVPPPPPAAPAAGRPAAPGRPPEDWEATPLHRTGRPGPGQSFPGGSQTLGLRLPRMAPPAFAARETGSQTVDGGRRTARTAVALVLAAAALGAGAWWYLHVPAVATAAGSAAAAQPSTPAAAGSAAIAPPPIRTGTGSASMAQAPRPPGASSTVAGSTSPPGGASALSVPRPAGVPNTPAQAAAAHRPAGSPALAPAAGTGSLGQEALGPGMEAAEPVSVPDAVYPAAARGIGKAPSILLAVLVDERGAVAEVRVKEGDASHLGFDEAAVAAAWKARFLPATRGGAPVRAWTELMIEFASPPHP